MKKLLSILILLLVSCAGTPTVGVATRVAGMNIFGTGVVISSTDKGTYILTAGHGIGPHGLITPWKRALYDAYVDNNIYTAYYIAHYIGSYEDGECDLGVLYIPGLDDATVADIAESSNLSDELIIKARRGEGSVRDKYEMYISAKLSGTRLRTNPYIELGDSGSGLYKDDELVGIVVAIGSDDKAIFVRHRIIIEFLEENDLGWILE